MAKIGHRIFALTFAVLFLVTSSFVAIAFILGNVESKNNSNSSSQTSNAAKSAPAANYPAQGQPLTGFTPVSSVSQLKLTDIKTGTGQVVKSGDSIDVEYSGAVASTGLVFQTSNTPISLSLSQVIPGWQQGIPGMRVGGSRQLLIPANLAYGSNPPAGSGIPANAPLVFDVTVTSING